MRYRGGVTTFRLLPLTPPTNSRLNGQCFLDRRHWLSRWYLLMFTFPMILLSIYPMPYLVPHISILCSTYGGYRVATLRLTVASKEKSNVCHPLTSDLIALIRVCLPRYIHMALITYHSPPLTKTLDTIPKMFRNPVQGLNLYIYDPHRLTHFTTTHQLCNSTPISSVAGQSIYLTPKPTSTPSSNRQSSAHIPPPCRPAEV